MPKSRSPRPIRWVVLGVAVLIGMAALAPIARAQGSNEKPTATEVGITDKEIRIAVVADVDNQIAPGIFQGSVDGVRGVAKYLNKHGGLAKRKVVVDFIDSKLSPNEARNAIIQACENDFAMIGTSSVFINNVDDQLACKDKAGAATGLPDLPFVATEVVQQCSPDTFPMAPPQVLCDTKDQHPQTFQASIGRAFYYEKKYGKNLHGVYVFGSDSKSARNATFSSLGQMRVVCCKSDKDFDVSFLAPQSAYTPIVQAIKDNNSNYAQHTSAFAATVTLRKEAKLQGVTSVKVWDCGTQCYDPQLIEQGGADVEDQYADTLYLPFLDAKERKANKMLANFYNFTGAGNVGKLGAPYAWSAGIALRDAVNAIVAKDGVNGVTRKSFLAAVANIHAFDADGMFGKIDLGGRLASPCHVVNQVQGGKFVRVFPKKPGTFDCAKKNIVHPKIDLFT